ncbi:MAG: DUF4350 domain-containing protein [Gemmatimonadaceae bacterium]|nr:DUF4350 domain-containing protein [Gemmatimonadaceae bacterium]
MTGGPPVTTAPSRWFARPSVVLLLVAVVVIVVALLTPEPVNGRSGDARLTTYSAQPQGAQLFYELAGRLGWTVARRTTPAVVGDPSTIQAELSPIEPLRALEVHALLDAVRRGGALLVVLSGAAGPLGDSLHVLPGVGGVIKPVRSADTGACPEYSGVAVPLWPAAEERLYTLRWSAPPPNDRVDFVFVSSSAHGTDSLPAVVGFPLGRGRVVVASDPDFLRNDALRVCRYGLSVAAVQALEYVSAGGPAPRRRVVFDEYHQGFGAQPGTMSAITMYLGGTASGHLLLQLLGAGVVLLLAVAPRALAPRDTPRVERRSPLEHVDALARAYAQVGATRTVVTRLVRGVRRRIGLAATRATAGQSDEAFLDWVSREAPDLTADAARVRRGLRAPVSRHELAAVGVALRHIEFSLTRLRS